MLAEEGAEKLEGIGVLWLGGEHLAVNSLRLGKTAGLVVGDGGAHRLGNLRFWNGWVLKIRPWKI